MITGTNRGPPFTHRVLSTKCIFGFGLLALVLFSLCLPLIRAARRLPVDSSPASKAEGQAIGRYYRKYFCLIFGLEILIISGGNTILYYGVHHPEYSMPFMAIVVGLHFLPLAPLFRVKLYYGLGLLMILAGILTMICCPANLTIGHARAWALSPV